MKSDQHKFGAIDTGACGTTIAKHLSIKCYQVRIWCKEAETANSIKNDHVNRFFLPDIIPLKHLTPLQICLILSAWTVAEGSRNLAKRLQIEMPLCREVYGIRYKGISCVRALQGLLKGPPSLIKKIELLIMHNI